MKNIYIGVDGGGTKTKIRIEDEDERLIGEARSGPAQIRISVDQAWNSIYRGIHDALQNTDIALNDERYQFYAGLGLAGTEFSDCYRQFTSRPHHFTAMCLKSDAEAACLGAHAGHDGAVIIIGTGTKGFQIERGHTAEAAGYGFPQDDMGSGAWIGLKAIQHTLRSTDCRIPPSPMTQAVLNHFGNLNNLLNWSKNATSHDYGTLAPLVTEYASENDHYATAIMKRAAGAIEEIAEALHRQRIDKTNDLPYCLFGGIAPFIKPLLSNKLKNRLTERRYGPAKGAIIMVKHEMAQ